MPQVSYINRQNTIRVALDKLNNYPVAAQKKEIAAQKKEAAAQKKAARELNTAQKKRKCEKKM
ncbi:2832_t:CDS:2 [Cetraspora pellucida]|uniref:2832_t:CDS:1 n=1 Tax=Cetraspora pellucida TaxID=1433469 RepID=A0ACA9M5Y6_9GLOM|nr:2832_t:CDS:2 [Cetraspora pellucida]